MISLNKNSLLNDISIFLFIAFPACLVIGPFAAEVSMNLISVFFIIDVIKNKKFYFINKKFFLIVILFYFYVILNSFFSNYSDKIFFNSIFYIRYIIFVYAVYNLLAINKKLILLFYKFLLLTIFIVVADGYIQFFFKTNLLGYEQIRPDRISGFFGHRLKLGGYLSRLFPLIIGLFFYNLELLNLRYKIISSILITLSFILIVISGDRTPFIVSVLFLLGIFILVDVKKIFKIFTFLIFLSLVFLIFFKFPVLFNRHYFQTINQVNFKLENHNFFSNFKYYSDTYGTAFKAFSDKKAFGQGINSFRYFCSDKKYETTTKREEMIFIEDFVPYENKDIILVEFNFFIGKEIKKDEYIFSYLSDGKLIKNFAIKTFRVINTNLKLEDLGKSISKQSKFINLNYNVNGCTTHPHNFYLQLLAETGIVGFIFVFSIFFYCLIQLLKILYFKFTYKKIKLNNFRICLLMGFVLTLLPFIPNGNFFNNWLNMMMYFPIGFYLFSLKKNDY